jgi:hypothetical protein
VLKVIFSHDHVARGRGISRQSHIFLSNLSRRSADLDIRPTRFERSGERILSLAVIVRIAVAVVAAAGAAAPAASVLLSLPHGLPSTIIFGLCERLPNQTTASHKLDELAFCLIFRLALRTFFRAKRLNWPAYQPVTPGGVSLHRGRLSIMRSARRPTTKRCHQSCLSQKMNRFAANDAREASHPLQLSKRQPQFSALRGFSNPWE